MKMHRLTYALSIVAFLLPWQTRYIFGQKLIGGEVFEYGVLSVYLLELLVLAVLYFTGGTFKWPKHAHAPIKRLAILFGLALLSSLWSISPVITLVHSMHIAFAGLFFLLLMDTRVNPKTVAKAFIWGLVLPLFVSFWQVIVGVFPDSSFFGIASRNAQRLGDAVVVLGGDRVLRAYGTLPHPNIFGGFIAVGLSLFVWMAKEFGVFKYAIGATLAVGLFLTFSQSAWLGFMLGLLLSFLVYKRVLKTDVQISILAVVLIGGLLGAVYVAPGVFASMGVSGFEVTSTEERIDQIEAVPSVIALRPFVGVGSGAYVSALYEANPGREWWSYQPVHNLPLLLFSELGVLGVILGVYWAHSIDRQNFARFPNVYALGAFTAGNTVLVILFFDHYLWTLWPGLALLSLVMALTVRLGDGTHS